MVLSLAALAVLCGLAVILAVCLWRGEPARATLTAEEKAARMANAEELADLARNFRALAKRYTEAGEKRKAHRAIGAAQELDRKIKDLRSFD